jgi:hypothetical protein
MKQRTVCPSYSALSEAEMPLIGQGIYCLRISLFPYKPVTLTLTILIAALPLCFAIILV